MVRAKSDYDVTHERCRPGSQMVLTPRPVLAFCEETWQAIAHPPVPSPPPKLANPIPGCRTVTFEQKARHIPAARTRNHHGMLFGLFAFGPGWNEDLQA